MLELELPQIPPMQKLCQEAGKLHPRKSHYATVALGQISATLLSMLLLTIPIAALAHAGHGDEFHQNQSTPVVGAIEVDTKTAERLRLKIEAVTRQSLPFGLQATGQIEALPSHKVEVTNPVGGTIIKLLVEPGDVVKVGQPLAVITSGELAELRVDALENSAERQGDVQQAQANLRLAQQNYDRQQKIAWTAIVQAKTELKVAQEQYDRDKELVAQGAIPRREFLDSETHLAEAKRDLTQAESQLEVLQAKNEVERAQTAVQVAQSRSQLSAGTYKTRLQQLGTTANPDGTITIKAPISGTIADRKVTLGQSAEDAGTTLMTIVDNRTVLATANIYEKDLSRVSQGQRVKVTVASLPNRSFEGRITTIGSVVEGDSRVVPVKAELVNANNALKPGMFAELELLTQHRPEPVLVIPQSAIVEVNGQQLVFVQNGNTFQATEITLGRRVGDQTEVKSGLFDGDRIVTQRANQLYAQSLRSGTTKSEGAATTEVVEANGFLGTWPWWVILAGGGLLSISTFAAGILWSNYRNKKLSMSANAISSYSEYVNNGRNSASRPECKITSLQNTEMHNLDTEEDAQN